MVLSSFLEEKNFHEEKYNIFVLVEQFNHPSSSISNSFKRSKTSKMVA